MKQIIEFEADVYVSTNNSLKCNKPITIRFEIKTESESLEPECELTYDDVEFALLDECDKFFPNNDYEVDSIFIIKDNEKYPVVAEENNEQMQQIKNTNYKKYLALPYARYSISDEYKFYMSLCKSNILDPDYNDFNFDEMHTILENLKAKDKNKDE